MAKFIKCLKDTGSLGAWISFIVAVILLTGAAIYPPPFIIDNSILVATSELLGFYVLFRLPNMIASIKEGKSLKITKGDMHVEVNSEERESA